MGWVYMFCYDLRLSEGENRLLKVFDSWSVKAS